jgi:50S ribosomal protein L16 3-hydroxylase
MATATIYNQRMHASLLGGLSARQFLSRYWQKKPLLVRQAVPAFRGPLTRAKMLQLVRRADLESRLVHRRGSAWQLAHGPFSRQTLGTLPARNWTLLLQGFNHVNAEADALLHRFDFIPHARQDDVMVSYAAPGGGVGPHLDSYDVFLLQGAGRRRWRIGPAGDTAFRPGLPLKILRNFKPRQEWVLEPGDMLYLPPGFAHEGVALDACFTYSIGFRAPSRQELASDFLDYLHDGLALDGMLTDPGLQPTSQPGALPPGMLSQARLALRRLEWTQDAVADFLARKLSEPKPHIVFDPPRPALGAGAFAKVMQSRGLALDARSRMLYYGDRVYLNGESVAPQHAARNDLAVLKQLADRRRLAPGLAVSAQLRSLLRSWYVYGFAHFDSGLNR